MNWDLRCSSIAAQVNKWNIPQFHYPLAADMQTMQLKKTQKHSVLSLWFLHHPGFSPALEQRVQAAT